MTCELVRTVALILSDIGDFHPRSRDSSDRPRAKPHLPPRPLALCRAKRVREVSSQPRQQHTSVVRAPAVPGNTSPEENTCARRSAC